MVLERDVVPEVHDRVEVQIEISAAGLPRPGHRPGQPGEQLLVIGAREAVAVAAQTAGFRQRFQASERRERRIDTDIIDMTDTPASDRFERQQRQDRGERRDLTRAREPRSGDRTREIQRDQSGEQQHHAGVVTIHTHRLLGPANHPHARRIITRRWTALTRRSGSQPLVALGDQHLPHPGAIQRRRCRSQRLGDLGDRVTSRPQPQKLIPGRDFRGRDPRAWATLDQELARLGVKSRTIATTVEGA